MDPVVEEEDVASMKASNTPQVKLFNWNIIIKQLSKLDIQVDNDTKSLVIAGDLPFTNEVLVQLYNYEVHLSPDPNRIREPSKPKPADSVDVATLTLETKTYETKNCLEFIIISLAHCFQKAPSDAADLLTNGN